MHLAGVALKELSNCCPLDQAVNLFLKKKAIINARKNKNKLDFFPLNEKHSICAVQSLSLTNSFLSNVLKKLSFPCISEHIFLVLSSLTE